MGAKEIDSLVFTYSLRSLTGLFFVRLYFVAVVGFSRGS